MINLDPIEQSIYNAGERLIPGVTHSTIEVVRHKSSYAFFRKVIEDDAISGVLSGKSHIRILDIGCGVGHGTYMLAAIPGAVVTGIDCSEDSIAYARAHYSQENITYVVADAIGFITNMPEFDYVVSRHSLEHIPDGINASAKSKFTARLMANVPFNEAEDNPHHHLHFICKDTFSLYENSEIFYEGLDGVTFDDYPAEGIPNSIICVSSKPPFPKVRSRLSFPIPPWQPEYLQRRWLEAFNLHNDVDLLERERQVASREKLVNEHDVQVASREKLVNEHDVQVASREKLVNEHDVQLKHRELDLAEKLQAYERLIFIRLYRKIWSFLK